MVKAWLGTTVLGAAIATLTVNAPALAQVDARVLRQQNVILQQQDIARQGALAAQREAFAAQNRYAAQMTLRSLDATSTSTEPTLRPALPAVPPRGPDPADMAVQAERMDRLTDQRLAQSNARLRAIKPAQ